MVTWATKNSNANDRILTGPYSLVILVVPANYHFTYGLFILQCIHMELWHNAERLMINYKGLEVHLPCFVNRISPPLSQLFPRCSSFLLLSVCIILVRARSQARPFFVSVIHVGILSVKFNKKSADGVFKAGMRFTAACSQSLKRNVWCWYFIPS